MRILLAIDGSEPSMAAVATVAALAIPTGSTVECLTVMPDEREVYAGTWPAVLIATDPDVRAGALDEIRERLESVAGTLEQEGLTIRTRVVRGRPASTIVNEATRMDADLIVLGALGHGAVERLVIGSVSAEVVDHAPCPVLVCRQSTAARLVVATDGSPDGEAAVAFVGSSGLFERPAIRVVSVVDPEMPWWAGLAPVDGAAAASAYDTVHAEATVRAEQAAAAAAATLEAVGAVEPVVATGDAPSAIVETAGAWDADLIVVGTRGHGAVKRAILGSTSRAVLHHAGSSVLVVRPPTPSE
jgi:nucleotide-binding universal stress UspA family protein